MGISPINMIEKKSLPLEKFNKMSAEEQFSLIDLETIKQMSDELIEKNKRK